MSPMLVLILAALAVGLALLGIGFAIRRAWQERQDRERARATGVVTGHGAARGGKGAALCPLRVRFDAEGQTHELESRALADPGRWPVGTPAEVLYDPDDPNRFHLEALTPENPPAAMLRVGLVWTAAALAALLIVNALPARDRMRAEQVFYGAGLPRISIVKGEKERESGGFSYRLNEDGTATITGYSGDDAELSLPLIADGHLVNGIGAAAFASSRALRRLTVPGTVADIPPGAFAGCLSLSEVELREGVRSLGAKAFAMCPLLSAVTLPESLTRIADDAFDGGCGAAFRAPEGSVAAEYCAGKGFQFAAEPQ